MKPKILSEIMFVLNVTGIKFIDSIKTQLISKSINI